MGERIGGAGWGGRTADRPAYEEDAPEQPGGRRRGPGLTGPLALAISGLVLYLAWCVVWERSHPAASATRGIRRGDAAARLEAIRQVERVGPQDPEVAIPGLIGGAGRPRAGESRGGRREPRGGDPGRRDGRPESRANP